MFLLKENSFFTPFGTVTCGISSFQNFYEVTGENEYEHGQSISFNTRSYNVEFVTFKRKLPLYNGKTVEDTFGWLWRINKVSADEESIQLHCLLKEHDKDAQLSGADCGEHLDAVMIENGTFVLHIGTEDGEIMHSRALLGDGMPLRLKNSLNFHHSFHQLHPNGFTTAIPSLAVGESIHFHYLSAFNKKNENSINTWLAVDAFKRDLENWVGIW